MGCVVFHNTYLYENRVGLKTAAAVEGRCNEVHAACPQTGIRANGRKSEDQDMSHKKYIPLIFDCWPRLLRSHQGLTAVRMINRVKLNIPPQEKLQLPTTCDVHPPWENLSPARVHETQRKVQQQNTMRENG